jgi:hypothetical protein
MEYIYKISGTMSDKVLARITTDNPHPESEQARYLKELWELSRNRISHALSQTRSATMSAMKKSCLLGNYIIAGDGNMSTVL